MKWLSVLLAAIFIKLVVSEVTYVVSKHEKQTALMKVYRNDDTGDITECYLFGEEELIEKILEHESQQEVNKGQFRKLMKECAKLNTMSKRVKRDREKLVTIGEKYRQEKRQANEQHKKLDKKPKVENEHPDKRRERRDADGIGFKILFSIYPGTLYCGAGNISHFGEDEDGLGEKKELDAACREHDKCPISVRGWSKALGLINASPITRSECPCDETFKNSLQSINDDDSNLVGDLFFNILNIQCIKLEHPLKCEKYRWLKCLSYIRDETAPKEYEFFDGLEYTKP